MKRIFAAAAAVLLLGGCTASPQRVSTPAPVAPSAVSTAAPAPATPAGTPPVPSGQEATTPPPVPVLLLADCEKEEAEGYVQGVRQAAREENWLLTERYQPEGIPDVPAGVYRGVLVLLTKEDTSLDAVEDAIAGGASCTILDMHKRTPPEGASYISYASEDAAALALTAALDYPPHDTPVRLIALLEKKGSPGDKAFRAAISEGKILSKGIFYAKGKPDRAGSYMEARLKKYVAGAVDAVYAEDTALASAALRELSTYGRTDMEVFAVPDGFLTKQSALLERFVFPEAMGVDPSGAAVRQTQLLSGLLRGEAPRQESIAAVTQKYQAQ